MKTITNYIEEAKQSFRIKSHLKKQTNSIKDTAKELIEMGILGSQNNIGLSLDLLDYNITFLTDKIRITLPPVTDYSYNDNNIDDMIEKSIKEFFVKFKLASYGVAIIFRTMNVNNFMKIIGDYLNSKTNAKYYSNGGRKAVCVDLKSYEDMVEFFNYLHDNINRFEV